MAASGGLPVFPLPYDQTDVAGLSDAARLAAEQMNAFESVSSRVARSGQTVVAQVEGDLTEPATNSTRTPSARAGDLSIASTAAAATMGAYAISTETYNGVVDRLNREYEAAKVAQFSVPADAGATEAMSEGQRSQARADQISQADAQLRERLGRQEQSARETLDRTGDQLADFLGLSPNQTLMNLSLTGLLPARLPGSGGELKLNLSANQAPPPWLVEAADQRFGVGFSASTGLTSPELLSLLATVNSVGMSDSTGDVMTAEELRTFIINNPKVAQALQGTQPQEDQGPAGELAELAERAGSNPGGGTQADEQARLAGRELFEGLSPNDAAVFAMSYPSVVGNLPGVPFEFRADANTVNIVAARQSEQAAIDDLRKPNVESKNDDLTESIAQAEQRIALYDSIIDNDRQIVVFDPADSGAMAEMHAPITSDTTNVGVLVPGTFSDLQTFQGNADKSLSFQEADPSGDLSMITWIGGEFPDSLVNAAEPGYSQDLAPRLAEFSRDLDLEISRSGGDAKVTTAGHSYGGAVVGLAETEGLITDRVLHIASAGMGYDVQDPDDLPDSQAGVDRYSMTAPGDPIGLFQGKQVLGKGHGADPDSFEGNTQLHTGNLEDGSLNTGRDAHSEVFSPNSDAWNNMYEVFTGGEVETYRTPEYFYDNYGGRWQVGWEDDGEILDIE